MHIMPMSRTVLDQDNLIESFWDLAVLGLRQQQYLETGERKDIFGQHQEIARPEAA